jgi:hypothetical protein
MHTEHLTALFHENFAAFGELGASVCVWHEGREVLSLAGGFRDRAKTEPWTAETPVLFWSATRRSASRCRNMRSVRQSFASSTADYGRG